MALPPFIRPGSDAVVRAGWPATDCVDRFYGLREFEVVDPEGHVLLFGQDIGPAP